MSISGVARVSLAATAAAVTALALALPSHAAPLTAPAAAPKGGAVVSVSGGDATVRQVRAHRYRLVVPKDASLAWVGDPGNGPLWGSFTPRSLMSGWTGLGHRAGVGVATTLTWGSEEEAQRSAELVLASDPRVNRRGELTFRIDTKDALPRMLDNFRMTVTRVDKGARAFPVSGQLQVSGPVYLSTTGTGGPPSYGAVPPSNGMLYAGRGTQVDTACWTYTHDGPIGETTIPSKLTCGGLYVTGSTFSQGNGNQTCLFDKWLIQTQKPGSGASPTMDFIPVRWTPSGTVIAPGDKC